MLEGIYAMEIVVGVVIMEIATVGIVIVVAI